MIRDTQIVISRQETCKACGSVNSLRKTQGDRERGTIKVASAKCKQCGLVAQIRVVCA
jgi:transcription elongation factor Elf1